MLAHKHVNGLNHVRPPSELRLRLRCYDDGSVEDVCILGFDYGNSTNALYEQRCGNAAIRGLQLQLKDAYHKVDET